MTTNSAKKINQKSSFKRWALWVGVIVLVVMLTVFWHIHRKETRQEEEQNKAPSVRVVSPKPSPKETVITLPATLQAAQETAIYARTNGYLTHWYHDIGDYVHKDTLLADIDTPDIEQQLFQAKGTLRQNEANLALAKITAIRWKSLLKENAVSVQDADEKQANYVSTAASVDAARADVRRLATLQSFNKLVAPFNGVITERTVDNGALVNSGSTGSTASPGASGNMMNHELFKIAEIDTMKTYVGVPQSEERAIKPGIEVEILLKEFPERNFMGVVARSSGEIDPVARTLLTQIDIPNSNHELLPGMYAQVKFHFPTPNQYLIVPANVIVMHVADPKIITVDENNTLHFASVVIGRDFGQETEIIKGLDAGARMVSNPNDTLVEGEHVTIEEKKQETPKAPKEESEKDKKEKDKKDEKSGKSDKNKDEGKADKKSNDNDTGGVNASSNSEDAVKSSNDKLPAEYKPKMDTDDKSKKDSDKKDGSS